jgi:hypothetical protein
MFHVKGCTYRSLPEPRLPLQAEMSAVNANDEPLMN